MAQPLTRLILFMISMALAACTMQPNDLQKENGHVQIDNNNWVSLPQPNKLGYTLTASQLLSVSYLDNQKKMQKNQLPIQLQVSQDKVVLAGFSSWGTRLLSLTYQNNQLDTYVMAGLGDKLPQPDQVLFNLMITLWPLEEWQPKLQQIGWQLTQSQTVKTKQRQLIDNQGRLIAEIHYASLNPMKGDITFINHALGFTIVIKTLQYQQH